ncbi:MAG: 50S ribosomal protein L25 [Desulfobacteraceae bacterium]|nr:50S ribosomal protein L25 [Desulfobacteraceae bacterium]
MEFSELNANIRTKTGNGPGRALRREGSMPAILYGPGTEPMSLAVNISEFERALKNNKTRMGQTVFSLNIQDGNKRSAMVKELQRHPLTGAFLHADFYEIAMDRKVKVKVPVITKGIAKGIDLGGMLQVIRREVEVLCFPNEIPNNIEIDVTELNVGDAIHVKDLKPEGNIEIIEDAEFTVLTLLGKKAEKETVAAEAAEGEEAAAEPAAAAKAKPEAKAAKSK